MIVRHLALSLLLWVPALLAAPPAGADPGEAPAPYHRLNGHLESGDYEALTRGLDDGTIAALAQAPYWAGGLARMLFLGWEDILYRAGEPEPMAALADRVQALAEACAARGPSAGPEPPRAHASALAAAAVLRRAAGQEPGPEPFEAASAILADLAERAGSARPVLLAEAAFALAAARPAGHRERWVYVERAAALLAGGAPDGALPAELSDSEMRLCVLRAEAFVDAGKKSEARKVLEAGLERLAPRVARAATRGDEATRWHNRLVAVGLRGKVGLKATLLLAEPVVLGGRVSLELPRTGEWEARLGIPDSLGAFQRIRAGENQVLVSVRSWGAGRNYSSDLVDSASSDNPAQMAALLESVYRPMLARVLRQRQGLKERLSRSITRTVGFDLEGFVDGEGMRRVRGWVFRSEARKGTIAVVVEHWGPQREIDPEVEAVLASIREVR